MGFPAGGTKGVFCAMGMVPKKTQLGFFGHNWGRGLSTTVGVCYFTPGGGAMATLS